MAKERKEPFGRPTLYCEELITKILDAVATNGCGIRKICEMYDFMPTPETINQWRNKYDNFSERYLTARKKQAHILFEAAIDIADETKEYEYQDFKTGAICIDSGIVALQRLRMHARTHQAARILPKEYGNQAESEVISDANTTEVAEKVAKIMKDSERDY